MKKGIFSLFMCVLGLLPVSSFSDEHYAASLSPADVQRAATAASPGDTVVMPAGDYSGFNSTVFLKNGVSLRGQGREKTVLRNTSGAIFLFIWNYFDELSAYKVKISGFKLIGHGDGSGSGVELNNIVDFSVYDLTIRDFSGKGVSSLGTSRGVIYNCDFINICRSDLSGTGYGVSVHGDGIWDNPKPPLGTKNAVYVENCYFSGCKHAIASNVNSHYVFRYNKVEGLRGFGVDAHGKQPAWPCGSNTYEIYKNTIIGSGLGTQQDIGMTVRGGSGVIYENKIYKCDSGWRPKAICISIDDHQAYPDPYQVRDLYIWGNTHNDVVYEDIFVADEAAPFVQKDREFFLLKKPAYVPYSYPHPLRVTSTPLAAEASASPLSGQVPLTVAFAGKATGGGAPYTYTWNFGDGGTSTLQNPSHTYRSVRTFTAAVTVRDSLGATDVDSVSITVTSVPPPLVAIGSASPISGEVPLFVRFYGQATGGVPPYHFRWNFGDQTNWGTQNPTHTYETAGNYTATLYVTDNQGTVDTITVVIIVVSPPPPLTATASASPVSGIAPLIVNFTGTAAGGIGPYAFSWNFGDGYFASGQNPSHTYLSAGNYIVALSVEDSQENVSSASVSIAVTGVVSYSLALSAQTGAPAPGQGGTTNPAPGYHSFARGSRVTVRALANLDYRFSRWTRDVPPAAVFTSPATILMDKNKAVSATFCVRCGDVTGDLKITPADAQAAFDIFLGRISDPSLCEAENADVNGSGTPDSPQVTPADAQGIFNKYLKKADLQSDCTAVSRADSAAAANLGEPSPLGTLELFVGPTSGEAGEDLLVPLVIDTSVPIGAFGFDLEYDLEKMTFLGLEKTGFTRDFIQVEGYEGEKGVVRVGGYAAQPAYPESATVLVALAFRITQRLDSVPFLTVIRTFDDLRLIQVREGQAHLPRRETRNRDRDSVKRNPSLK